MDDWCWVWVTKGVVREPTDKALVLGTTGQLVGGVAGGAESASVVKYHSYSASHSVHHQMHTNK